ncbi:MAG TPA: hypothetical protein VM051_00690 [Usitatibacter sp.]|nr:hypothetical protein [Usitatibacter sp.]
MNLARLVFALVTWFATLCAQATPQMRNGTDLWLAGNAGEESGWGLYLAHQGDTIFATLFVYGADNQPRWYSAPNMTGNNFYEGPLYESTGTPIGVPFDETTVTRRQVGKMTLGLREGSATLSYTIDGVFVADEISPFAFKLVPFSGQYTGTLTQPTSGSNPAVTDVITFSIDHSVSSFTMKSQGTTSGACTFTGTPVQKGSKLYVVDGKYTCADNTSGRFEMHEADLTIDGFTANFVGARVTDFSSGRIEALRMGPGVLSGGWMSDLWLAPGESGWGLNMVGQGNNMFATVFAYGPDRKPKWYSIPDLVFTGQGSGPEDRGTYSGNVYESTGPWFGLATFDPSKVTRRRVGSASVRFLDNRTALLDLVMEGATVRRELNPFAFRANDLSGLYDGHIVNVPASGPATSEFRIFQITDNGTAVTIAASENAGSCTYSGTRSQYGQRLSVAGSYTCSHGPSGNFALSDVEVSYRGFTAGFGNFPGSANLTGHMGGARRGAFGP